MSEESLARDRHSVTHTDLFIIIIDGIVFVFKVFLTLKRLKQQANLSVCVCLTVCLSVFCRQTYLRNQWSNRAIKFDKVTASVMRRHPVSTFSSLHLELWSHEHVLQDTGQWLLSKHTFSVKTVNDVRHSKLMFKKTCSHYTAVGETGWISIKAMVLDV